MSDGLVSGPERAAILLRVLGEEQASRVMQHMGVKDVQAVSAAMIGLEDISVEKLRAVLTAFGRSVEGQTAFGMGTQAYVRSLLERSLGPERARGLLDNVLESTDGGFEEFRWMEPAAIAGLIAGEHPQVMAIVISALESEQAARVLTELPEEVRTDVVLRTARLESIQPSALEKLKEALLAGFGGGDKLAKSRIGGTKSAAKILNELDADTQGRLQEQLRELDADLSAEIEDQMFLFERLLELDDRDIQVLLREIETDQLVTALKGASPKLVEKIFRGMSRRAGELLRDDLEMKGPVRLGDVEDAQKAIIATVRRLGEDGVIALGGGENYV